MNVLFAGGVTGGHIAPGIALAERIVREEPRTEVLFASVANDVEERMIVRRGFRLVKVAERRAGRAAAAVEIARACLRARRVLESFQPDAVIGLGGGASFGTAIAAILKRCPLLLLEQNAVPGRANRWLAPRALQVFCQWEEAARSLGSHAAFTGSPVRAEIAAARSLDRCKTRRDEFGLDPNTPTLLVMGGSQGAHTINVAMVGAAKELTGHLQVIHIAGERDNPTLLHAYRAADLPAYVASFYEKMHLAYAAADFALSRAGATSIAELAAAHVPAILVPYPHAQDDHQRANARAAAAQGWVAVIDPSELTAERIVHEARQMLSHPEVLEEMRSKAAAVAGSDPAQRIISVLQKICSKAENKTISHSLGDIHGRWLSTN